MDSFSEYYNKSFNKLARRCKYNNVSLNSLLSNDVSLGDFPICGELKNKFDETNLKDQILEVIKDIDQDDYNSLIKYADLVSIKKSYQNVFIFNYDCSCEVSVMVARYVRTSFSNSDVFTKTHFIHCGKQEIIALPKNKLNLKNIKESNFNEIVTSTVSPCSSQKTINQFCSELKQKAMKYIKKEVKKVFCGWNYSLIEVNFQELSLKRFLIPFYYVHCKKPGFDIKYVINANTKKCI